LGRFIALFKPLKKEYRTFFFFPFHHVGGAERVHVQIAKANGGSDCIIYFTRKSASEGFLQEFIQSGCTIKDIAAFTDNKWLYFLNFIYRGIISGQINRQKQRPIVFNGQSNFGYKISPWIHKNISQVELIHALNSFSYIRLPFIRFYTKSVTVSQNIIDKHKKLYSSLKVPSTVWEKFNFIMSRVKLPIERIKHRDFSENPITVLYVGRDSVEKRPHIVSALAKRLAAKKMSVKFVFAGNVERSIPLNERPYCQFFGDINDESKLGEVYQQSHILIIPSSTESGPLVFMEAMARGMVIVSTPVGYIPVHIKNGVSGFVTSELADEAALVNEMEELIKKLLQNRDSLSKMGSHNVDYAYNNFDIRFFNQEYQSLFEYIRLKNETA
jgi:glycosyltransferase involved in cell wall biosynthesis